MRFSFLHIHRNNLVQRKIRTHFAVGSYYLLMAQRKGFAPLAARPGEQPTGLFSRRSYFSVFLLPCADNLPLGKFLHPQIPFCYCTQQNIGQTKVYPIFWRRERDLNPWIHSCITRFRIVRVRPLRHLCKQPNYYILFLIRNQAFFFAIRKFLCIFRSQKPFSARKKFFYPLDKIPVCEYNDKRTGGAFTFRQTEQRYEKIRKTNPYDGNLCNLNQFGDLIFGVRFLLFLERYFFRKGAGGREATRTHRKSRRRVQRSRRHRRQSAIL